MNKQLFAIGLSSALALGSISAQAAVEWKFTQNAVGSSYGSSVGYTYTAQNSSDQVTASGWAATGNPGGTLQNYDSSIRHWSGGMGLNRYNDEHTVDNIGPDEFVMFSFDSDITLSSFKLGYAYDANNNSQADVTVLAWTGAGTPTPMGETISDTDANGIIQQGWTLVGHYGNVGEYDNQSIGTTISSSYWAFGAYMSDLSGSCINGGCGAGNDGFKLKQIAGEFDEPDTPPPSTGVPEPATLSLFGLGLLGLMRKRKLAA